MNYLPNMTTYSQQPINIPYNQQYQQFRPPSGELRQQQYYPQNVQYQQPQQTIKHPSPITPQMQQAHKIQEQQQLQQQEPQQQQQQQQAKEKIQLIPKQQLNEKEDQIIQHSECNKCKDYIDQVSKLQFQVKSLYDQNQKLNELIKENNLVLQQKEEQSKNKFETLQQKISKLVSENDKLNEIFLESQSSQQKQLTNNQIYYELEQALKKECHEKEKFQEIINNDKETIISLEQQNTELVNKFKELIQKVNIQQLKDQELEACKSNFQEYQNKMNQQQEELKQIIQIKNQEISLFKEVEAKIKDLVYENEKLNEAFVEKSLEVEVLKQQLCVN